MKVADIKKKVAEKVAKGKKKVAKKCGGKTACAALAALVGVALVGGCQNPAQRAQTCEVNIYAYDASKVTLGTESVTLAQSNETGGNDAGQTATPTNTTTPEVAVGVAGGSAATGKSGGSSQSGTFSKIGSAIDAASSLFSGDETDGGSTNAVTATSGDCADGECEPAK